MNSKITKDIFEGFTHPANYARQNLTLRATCSSHIPKGIILSHAGISAVSSAAVTLYSMQDFHTFFKILTFPPTVCAVTTLYYQAERDIFENLSYGLKSIFLEGKNRQKRGQILMALNEASRRVKHSNDRNDLIEPLRALANKELDLKKI